MADDVIYTATRRDDGLVKIGISLSQIKSSGVHDLKDSNTRNSYKFVNKYHNIYGE